MHFTEPVYRNPYWPTWPLIQITQGCTHNHCKFCTMYRDVPFRMMKVEDIEEDAKEIAAQMPHAKTIQLLSANPLALTYDNLFPRLEAIRRHLPELEFMYTATRVYVNDTPATVTKPKAKSGKFVIIEVNTDYMLSSANLVYTMSMIAGAKQVKDVASENAVIQASERLFKNYSETTKETPRGKRTQLTADKDKIILL